MIALRIAMCNGYCFSFVVHSRVEALSSGLQARLADEMIL